MRNVPMKVLMTTDTLGGVWTFSMELCAALQEYGIVIELASMGRKLSPEQRAELSDLPHVRLHESDYRLCWMQDNPWPDVKRAGSWLLNLERKLKPDLVQLNDLGHGGLPWQSPVILVGHSCVYSWWHAVRQQLPDAREWSRYRSAVRASVRRADWVVAPSRAMLDSLLHYYGPAQVSMVIPNGRGYPPLAPEAPYGDGETKDALIFASGRIWDQAKNINMLVGVAEHLPWPVYVAGEQADPGVDTAVGTSGEAHYLGFLNKEDMAHCLRRAAIYVAPAYYEPFGLGILEAARAGCALVLGDIPSLREVWGDAAEYLPPDRPEQLQVTINQLVRNPARRRRLANRAWQRAQVYPPQRMGSDYLQCYRSLLSYPVTAGSKASTGMAGART